MRNLTTRKRSATITDPRSRTSIIASLLFITTLVLPCLPASARTTPAQGGLDGIEQMINDGWWSDAEEKLAGIIEADGNNAEAHYMLGYIYMLELDRDRRGHWDEAEEHAKRAVELDGDRSKHHILLGNVMALKARLGSKLAAFGRVRSFKESLQRAIEIDPDNIEARNWLITFHINAPGFLGGDKDEAKRLAADIAKIDPVEGHYALAAVYERAENDPGSAEKELLSAIEMKPGDPEPYYRHATLLRRQQRFDEAFSSIENASRLDPYSSKPGFELGRIYEDAEAWDDAARTYKRLAEVDSTRQQAFMRLGFMYQQREMWDEALVSLERALESDPADLSALYQIGRTCVLAEFKLKRAEEAFNTYIGSNINGFWPAKASAYWRLAMVYELMDERKKAIAALREARRLDEEHKEARKMLRRLKRR